MGDDWRLQVGLHEAGRAHTLTERLEASELEHDLETSFDDRIVVSRDAAEVFFYAGSRAQAERAEELIRSLAADHDWHVDYELKHWHESAESWEDPDMPLPESDQQRAAERAALMQAEREQARSHGYPEFEVRVQCSSRHDAAQFSERLTQAGVPSLHRWSYLVIGATDEDSANALADRLREQAPAGSTVTVEGTPQAAYAERPVSPFAIFGGLGT
jgi:hypothetical protein